METRPTNPLTAYRLREGLSQRELAKRLKVKQPSLSKWERGHRRIDVENLSAVVKVTGIPARVLRPDLAVLFLPGLAPKRSRLRRAA